MKLGAAKRQAIAIAASATKRPNHERVVSSAFVDLNIRGSTNAAHLKFSAVRGQMLANSSIMTRPPSTPVTSPLRNNCASFVNDLERPTKQNKPNRNVCANKKVKQTDSKKVVRTEKHVRIALRQFSHSLFCSLHFRCHLTKPHQPANVKRMPAIRKPKSRAPPSSVCAQKEPVSKRRRRQQQRRQAPAMIRPQLKDFFNVIVITSGSALDVRRTDSKPSAAKPCLVGASSTPTRFRWRRRD